MLTHTTLVMNKLFLQTKLTIDASALQELMSLHEGLPTGGNQMNTQGYAYMFTIGDLAATSAYPDNLSSYSFYLNDQLFDCFISNVISPTHVHTLHSSLSISCNYGKIKTWSPQWTHYFRVDLCRPDWHAQEKDLGKLNKLLGPAEEKCIQQIDYYIFALITINQAVMALPWTVSIFGGDGLGGKMHHTNPLTLCIVAKALYTFKNLNKYKTWNMAVGIKTLLYSRATYDLGLSFLPLYKARSDTLATFTTLKRTPGISPTAWPLRPNPATRTSSFS